MMVVDVSTEGDFRSGVARRMFFARDYPAGWLDVFDVSPDGERFLLVRRSPAGIPRTVNVILNWGLEFERLVSSR